MTKASQSETRKLFPSLGLGFELAGLLALLALSSLLYYGYCWGWWGRNSLLLQYLLQCRCPAASEQSRYPEEVEIVISACRGAGVWMTPSRHYLYVYERISAGDSAHLLDLKTMTEREVPYLRFSNFLTDQLWYLMDGLHGVLIDTTTGTDYPIYPFMYYFRPNARLDGKANLDLLLDELRRAERIFIDDEDNVLVVLMPDAFNHLDQNFFFEAADLPEQTYGSLEELLGQNHIQYVYVPPLFPYEAKSPDGRLVARWDGIFLVETGEEIVEGPRHGVVRGWVYDSSSVIYSSGIGPCLLHPYFPPASDAPGCFIHVAQPVVKLRVPERYYSPSGTQ